MAPTEMLAEQHFLTVEELCRQLGVRVGLLTSSLGEGPARGDGASIVVGTHALIQEGVELERPRRRRHRRAAPLRRRAAQGAGGGPGAAHAPYDCDADPAHARADGVRRPRGQRDRAASRGPQAGDHELGHAGAEREAYRRLRAPPRRGPAGLRHLPAHLRVGDDRGARGRGGGRRGSVAPSCASSGSDACTGSCARRIAATSWAASKRASWTCSWRRP